MKINVGENGNELLYGCIEEVMKSLIEGFVVVLMVVYVLLEDMGCRLIGGIGIGVGLIGSLLVLKVIGFSVKLVRVWGMVVGIGIVVEDGIVVVEGVDGKLEEG